MRTNKLLQHKGFCGSLEIDVEENLLHGKVIYINDTVTYEGSTPEELEDSFKEAVDDYLETCKQIGKEPEKAFSGSFNIRIGPELHRRAAIEAQLQNISLNDYVRRIIADSLDGNKKKVTHVHKVQFGQEQSYKFEGKSEEIPNIVQFVPRGMNQ